MSNQARLIFFISIVVTAVLYSAQYAVPQLRWVAYPLFLLSTVAHELGHGITAILVGGEFQKLVVNADGSGVAYSAIPDGRFRAALVSAGGLLGPAIAAAILLLLGSRPRGARICLAIVGIAMLAAVGLWVRNIFGAVFVSVVGLAALGIAVRAPLGAAQSALVFAAVQLGLAVFSRSDYLFTPTVRVAGGENMASDVGAIEQALFLPYWFWGGVCAVFSLAALVAGMTGFLRATRGGTPTAPAKEPVPAVTA